MQNAIRRGLAFGGIAVGGALPLKAGPKEVCHSGDRRNLAGVVADRHVAAVVLVPETGRVLLDVRDVVPGCNFVRSVEGGICERDRRSDVEYVRSAAAGAKLLHSVHLILAAAGGVVGRDWDFVLGGETVDDGAVVGPVAWHRDDVELAFGLRRGNQGVHSAAVRRGGRRLGAGARGSPAASRRSTRRHHQERRDGHSETTNLISPVHSSLPK